MFLSAQLPREHFQLASCELVGHIAVTGQLVALYQALTSDLCMRFSLRPISAFGSQPTSHSFLSLRIRLSVSPLLHLFVFCTSGKQSG